MTGVRDALSHLVRALPDLRRVRGGMRAMMALLGPETFPRTDEQVVESDGVRLRLTRSSLLEWIIFHFGDYEGQEIRLFLRATAGRQGVILDVGANIGNHALRFARAFERVYAFEPNPEVFARLKANMALNPRLDVRAFNMGLGSAAATLPFHAPTDHVAGRNWGTGTFVETSAPTGMEVVNLPIVRGDDILRSEGVGRVDAIKIDVQGFEPEVLKGLRETLVRDRPVIWFEGSADTLAAVDAAGGLDALIPYEFDLRIFRTHTALGLVHNVELVEVAKDIDFPLADYVIVPREAGGT